MALSAADLQKQLEGAPDPFPSLNDAPASKPSASNSGPLNTDSEDLFPSLATPNTPKQATTWSVRAVKPVSAPVFTDSFSLTGIDPSAYHTRDGKPKSLGDIIKDVQTKFKVKVEVSSQRTSNQTTFSVTGPSDSAVESAKKALTTSLSPQITLTVQAPASAIGTIIGPKGATMKRIREQTSTRIDIPGRGKHAQDDDNGSRSISPLPTPAEDGEALVPIKIVGAASMAHEAQAIIQGIIAEKTSKTTQKIKVTPPHVYPFVLLRRADFLKAANGADINLSRDDGLQEITASGDREAVSRVIESIRSCIAFYEGDLTSVKISLPKRQHRLFDGVALDQIIQKSKCSVVIPAPEDPSEDVHVWGRAANLGIGLQAVMEKANSQHTHSIPIRTAPRHVLTHIHQSGYGKTLNNAHPSVNIHFPAPSSGASNVDFVGEKVPVEAAHKELAAYLALMEGATRSVQVDYLIHNILRAKAGKQLKGYHESKNVLVYFPPENEADSNVILVYDPHVKAAIKKQAALAEIEAEILSLVATLGQIKTDTISVERKWHEALRGKNNSTLNAIIGEGRALAIDVGGNGLEDIVVIRGSPTDVDRATKEVLRIVEEAMNDAIDSSYVTEFQIPQQFVARIVGAAGSGIQKYREQLDVKIDIEDLRDSGEQIVGKKKKTIPSNVSLLKITGRKPNAEEAKKRILAQVDKMADETAEIIKIPRQYHSIIIGQQGKYIQRLQDKYGVKITMPKESSASTDEIHIRGGKKGVSQAKNEIQELVEYEKENNHSIVVNVTSRAVPRILGSKGAKIHEIMSETGAHIDVGDKDRPKDRDEGATTAVTIKGTKKAVAAAKSAVMAIAAAVDDESTVVLHIEPKFHRTIIGGGGVGLRNLLARVGAPSDPKEQVGLVRFPQNGDEVTLRGERGLVKKIQVELERVVAGLRERVVLGVSIPASQHRMLIGHGGQPLMELEKRTGAEVQFPGSRSYNQVAPAENASELQDADPKDVVKVVGPRSACEKAIAELLESVAKAPGREKREPNKERTTSNHVATVQIPFKHYHLLQPAGNLTRELRSLGVNFSQQGKPKHDGVAEGRIDDETDLDAHGVEWKLVEYGADTEDGATELTLKARDEAALEDAQKLIEDAIKATEKITHVGLMTFPDRSAFPRVIGNKGSVINDLCMETGSEIIVPRDDTTIKIYGGEESVHNAKAAITRVAFGGRRRNGD
ncbi:hypothetical protein FRC18_000438 [Serendipita sp. 400]|nr:hypothetical protein FRC18_000438 [Serendipita sp. 400]